MEGTGCSAQTSDEGAPHQVGARETTSHGDLLKSFFASLDHPLCRFDPQLPNVTSRRHSHLSREYSFEIAKAHGDAVGKKLQ
jgi:hypothetical protein